MIQHSGGFKPPGKRIRLPLFSLLLFTGFFLAAPGLGAQAVAGPPPPTAETPKFEPPAMNISPDEAVTMALRNNLSLGSSRIGLDTKKRKSDLVWNQFLPGISVSGSLARPNEGQAGMTLPFPPEMGGPVTMAGSDPQWAIAGSLSISWNINAALFAGIKAIREDYQSGLISYDKAKIQLERDVRKSYYSMLLLQENISLLRESYAAAERQVEMAQANYRTGRAPQLTLLQAQVARDNLKPTIDQAENGLKLAMANFAFTLGIPYNTRFELMRLDLQTVFAPLDLGELIYQASQKKPDSLELKQSIIALQASRKAQAIQLYTPSLSLSWGLAPTSADAGKNWSDQGRLSLSLALSLNGFFPFTTQGQALKDLDNNIQSLNIGLAQAIQGTELEIYNTILSLEKTRSTLEAQGQTTALAEQSYKLTEEAYRSGLQDLLQVQNAELELRRARLGVLEQNFAYIQGLIDLEYSIGVPFGTLSGSVE